MGDDAPARPSLIPKPKSAAQTAAAPAPVSAEESADPSAAGAYRWSRSEEKKVVEECAPYPTHLTLTKGVVARPMLSESD